MATHIPINHPMRPVYRTLAALVGGYTLVFGIRGIIASHGLAFFQQDHLPWVMWLRANPAFSVLSILAGAVLLIANLIGRNLDHYVDLTAAAIFLFSGMAMMTLLQSNANFLGFSMINCIVSFVFGLITLLAGLYGKIGPAEEQDTSRKVQESDADREISPAS